MSDWTYTLKVSHPFQSSSIKGEAKSSLVHLGDGDEWSKKLYQDKGKEVRKEGNNCRKKHDVQITNHINIIWIHLTGWCSTPTLLLICWWKENCHPLAQLLVAKHSPVDTRSKKQLTKLEGMTTQFSTLCSYHFIQKKPASSFSHLLVTTCTRHFLVVKPNKTTLSNQTIRE